MDDYIIFPGEIIFNNNSFNRYGCCDVIDYSRLILCSIHCFYNVTRQLFVALFHLTVFLCFLVRFCL